MDLQNLDEAVQGATPGDVRGIREAFLKGVGLETTSSFDESCFVINPPSDKIILFVRKVGTTKVPLRLFPDANGVIGLDSLDDADFDVEVCSTGTTPLVSLHKFVITKTPDGVSVTIVDTLATAIEAVFSKANSPLAGADVLGTFTDSTGKLSKITGNTDADGKFHIVLPAGTVQDLVAKKGDLEVPSFLLSPLLLHFFPPQNQMVEE